MTGARQESTQSVLLAVGARGRATYQAGRPFRPLAPRGLSMTPGDPPVSEPSTGGGRSERNLSGPPAKITDQRFGDVGTPDGRDRCIAASGDCQLEQLDPRRRAALEVTITPRWTLPRRSTSTSAV